MYQHILSLFHIPLPEYPTVLNVIPVPLLMLCEPILKTIIDVESCIALIAHLSSEFLWIKGCWNKVVLLDGPWARRAMTRHGHGSPYTGGRIPR